MYLPASTYLIEGPGLKMATNVSLIGDGNSGTNGSGTQLQAGSTLTSMISAAGTSGIVLSKIYLSLPPLSPYTVNQMIDLTGATGAILDRLRVQTAAAGSPLVGGGGILVNGAANGNIIKSTIVTMDGGCALSGSKTVCTPTGAGTPSSNINVELDGTGTILQSVYLAGGNSSYYNLLVTGSNNLVYDMQADRSQLSAVQLTAASFNNVLKSTYYDLDLTAITASGPASHANASTPMATVVASTFRNNGNPTGTRGADILINSANNLFIDANTFVDSGSFNTSGSVSYLAFRGNTGNGIDALSPATGPNFTNLANAGW